MRHRRLELAGILKTFAGVRALDHVSLAVDRGEVPGLVGGNGAGKSSLIKVLAGIHQPDRGELRLDREPVRLRSPAHARRLGIATIHQEANLVPTMSVARNLFLGREPRRFGLIETGRMNTEAAELLARHGVREDVRRPLGTLRPGDQHLVALLRAASSDAKVIAMDEPTAGLEPPEADRLFSVIAELRRQGRSVLYVTHRLDELYRLCDRVTVLRGGRVVHTGPVAGLDRRRLISVMLGRAYHRGVLLTFPHPAAPIEEPPVLEATGLTRQHMLSGVSLALHPGEVVGLGGLLGAGRSETARAIAGALTVDEGQVRVAGTVVRRWSVKGAIRAGVSLLPENRDTEGVVARLSVRDNIALAALPRLSRAGIVSDARVDRIVTTLMERLDIRAVSPRQPVSELSGGNQQKVLLARWLATNPRVLLLDEPTRGVDVATKSSMRDLLDELAVDGVAVLLTSSDPAELADNCDRVIVLRDGTVAGELAGSEVTEDGILAAITSGAR